LRVLFGSFRLLQQHLDGNSAAAAGDGSSTTFSACMLRQLMSSLLSLIEMPAIQAEVPANVLQAVQQQAAAAKQRYGAAERAARRIQEIQKNSNSYKADSRRPPGRATWSRKGSVGSASKAAAASAAAASAAAAAALQIRHGMSTRLAVSASGLEPRKVSRVDTVVPTQWPMVPIQCVQLGWLIPSKMVTGFTRNYSLFQ
jgi:hypothetical protein